MQLSEADEKGIRVVRPHLVKSHVPDWQDSDSDESDEEGGSDMPPTPAAALTTSHVTATPTTVKPSSRTCTTSRTPSATTTSNSITGTQASTTSTSASRRVDVVITPTSWTSRHIQAALTIHAPLEVVWAALTDYDHLHTFIPGLVENRCLERRPAGCLLFQKSSQHIALGVRFAAGVTLDIQEYPAGLPPALAAAPGAHDYTHKYPVPAAAFEFGSTTSSQTSTNGQPVDGGSSSRDDSRSTTSTVEEQACQVGTGGTSLEGRVPPLDALNLGDSQLTAQEGTGGEPVMEHSNHQGVQPQPSSCLLQGPDAGGSDPAAVGLTSSSADITFSLVKGDFAAFKGIWRMQRHPAAPATAMRLSYAVYVQPQPWLPVALVQGRIEREIMANLRAVAAYAEGQAVPLESSAAEGPAGSI